LPLVLKASGLFALADSLLINRCLTELDLSKACISLDLALLHNLILFIGGSDLGGAAAGAIAEALDDNQSLRILNLSTCILLRDFISL
jgi:hypothetical protein